MSLVEEADEVVALVHAIELFLAGRASEVQGAALADLLAMWLAGHVVRGDPQASEAYREKVLELHLDAVRRLIPVNYEARIEPKLRRSQQ
jgi:hemerythrin